MQIGGVLKEIQVLTVFLYKWYGRCHYTEVIFLTLPDMRYK